MCCCSSAEMVMAPFARAIKVPTGGLFAYSSVFRDLNGDKTPEAIVDTGGAVTVLLNTSRPR